MRRFRMKWFRTFIALAVMGLWVTTGMAQVAFDFEDEALGTQGFADNGWGPALTSVAWAADPTGMSTGVLALGIDGSKDKGVIQVDGWDPGEADVISFMLYLPAGFPDGINFSLWGQDNQNWGWCEGNVYVSTDLPKDTWVPISFLIQYKSIVQANFNPYGDNKFGKAGLQIYLGTNG